MQKSKFFSRAKFAPQTIIDAIGKFEALSPIPPARVASMSFYTSQEDESWDHDSLEEFLSEYSRQPNYARIDIERAGSRMEIQFDHDEDGIIGSTVRVRLKQRAQIEGIIGAFERSAATAVLPSVPKAEPIIFIGHGHDQQWQLLKNHLQDQHQYKIEAYEVGARAGHHIRDILEQMATKSHFALLVLTGESADSEGKLHARENVIHETGLFQGKLGWNRAIVLLEEGTSEFSNIHGIHQLRFSKGRIKETFGDVLATLKREFGR